MKKLTHGRQVMAIPHMALWVRWAIQAQWAEPLVSRCMCMYVNIWYRYKLISKILVNYA
jgi:hypothetical protein